MTGDEVVTGLEAQAEEALAELYEELNLFDELPIVEKMQPGDLTFEMLQEKFGWRSMDTIKSKMAPLIEAKKYVKLKVYDTGVQRQRWVYRKKQS